MNRIRAGWIRDFRRTAETALDQMSRESAVFSETNFVVLTVNFSRDRDVAGLGLLRRPGHHNYPGDRLQCFALLRVRLLVHVIVGKIPFSERLHHAFAFWALAHIGND